MWYPSQQQRWHRHPRQPPAAYSRTSYYCPADEPSTSNRATPAYMSRSDENDPSQHYHSTRADDAYGTGTDHYVTTPTGSHRDEMSSSPASSLPYYSPNTHWNPIIAAPSRPAAIANSMRQAHRTPTTSSSSSSSTAACWDWLLYSPDVYSHLYRPSSTFAQQTTRDDDCDLLANVPGWLRVALCPSLKSTYASDDENESDQEISSLHNRSDEPSLSMKIDNKITHVSSNLSLSSESTLNEPKLTPNRSSTPDTDDGYQSASDASRSDYSQPSSAPDEHHPSKPAGTPLPRRISYAAAAKPLPTPVAASKTSSGAAAGAKAKHTSSALMASELAGQKLKFIAPRFERMHHAKQYPSPATAPTTTGASKDSPSSSSSFSHRTAPRSNNSHHQRNPVPHATRRR